MIENSAGRREVYVYIDINEATLDPRPPGSGGKISGQKKILSANF